VKQTKVVEGANMHLTKDVQKAIRIITCLLVAYFVKKCIWVAIQVRFSLEDL
jgi:hypothetical protein